VFIPQFHRRHAFFEGSERPRVEVPRRGVGKSSFVVLDNIGLTVGNLPRFVTTLAFSAAMNQSGFGLLGQQGFYNRFKVDFDLLRRFFYIEDSIARPTDPLAFPPPSARH
jgi:hypothetical protein